jgi:hypothetical protein
MLPPGFHPPAIGEHCAWKGWGVQGFAGVLIVRYVQNSNRLRP